jgi:hypothetical protein
MVGRRNRINGVGANSNKKCSSASSVASAAGSDTEASKTTATTTQQHVASGRGRRLYGARIDNTSDLAHSHLADNRTDQNRIVTPSAETRQLTSHARAIAKRVHGRSIYFFLEVAPCPFLCACPAASSLLLLSLSLELIEFIKRCMFVRMTVISIPVDDKAKSRAS